MKKNLLHLISLIIIFALIGTINASDVFIFNETLSLKSDLEYPDEEKVNYINNLLCLENSNEYVLSKKNVNNFCIDNEKMYSNLLINREISSTNKEESND